VAKINTRDRFLQASGKLFRSQGYEGTGLKQIVIETGAPWGSLYHFFPEGKEQLAAETVQQEGALDEGRLNSAFSRADSPEAVIQLIFKAEMCRLKDSNFVDGCPVASIASDVAVKADRVRMACSETFSRWEDAIARGFQNMGIEMADAEILASFLLSALEGATLLSRTYRSTAPLKNAMIMVAAVARRGVS